MDSEDPSDVGLDPDLDGLTNIEEYGLRSDPVKQQDLFVEIDYMPGYGPTDEALEYLTDYYITLPTDIGKGIKVHITIDDEVPYEQDLE
jgi:hypothetical protein